MVLGATFYVASEASPWPRALLIRQAFNHDAARVAAALLKHVPAGVASRPDVQYSNGQDAFLDVYYPERVEGSDAVLPTIVWVHGGAWISGSRKDVGNYLSILASGGYTAVSVDYSTAPGATYPTPVRQVNEALAYLAKNGRRLHVDASRIVLAGDSAGAQIVAQIANMISVRSYADAVGISPALGRNGLKGVILHCGAYDIGIANFKGPYGGFLRTVLWSYLGTRDFKDEPAAATASVVNYLTPDFPPAFISSGNGDPLTPQSRAMVEALTRQGVSIDVLFFPDETTPALPHEYQFNLDTEAGQLALQRTRAFLSGVFGPGAA
jgi:acetyl esterase/lipase